MGKIIFALEHKPKDGGGYVQGLNYFSQFSNELANLDIDICIISNNSNFSCDINNSSVDKIYIPFLRVRKRLMTLLLSIFPIQTAHKISKIFSINIEKALLNNGVELVFFLGPTPLISLLGSMNFITCSWDLSHREDVEFPEVREPTIFFQREFWISNYYKMAYRVICDSEESKQMLIKNYCLDPARIISVPFQPNGQLKYGSDISSRAPHLGLELGEEKYIFYPAQFWPHKSHVILLEAVKILRQKGQKLKLIFSGGDKGNKSYLIKKVNELGISDAVVFSGFVTNDVLNSLYANCSVVVMPSWFGPTNLPPLEGLKFGKPVLLPDKKAFRDFYGKSCHYFHWPDENSMAQKLLKLLHSDNNKKDADFSKFTRAIAQGKLEVKEAVKTYFQISRLWQ